MEQKSGVRIGLTGANEPPEDRSASGDDRVRFSSLVVLASLLFLLAYLVGFGLHWTEARMFAKDILFALATAILITWGLTRMVEIPHVANYVAGKLADVMFGEQYLINIKASLPVLRKRIDKVLYGDAALGYPWSLYNFVDSRVHEFYKSSFRRNFTVEIECEHVRGTNLMRWTERTTFIYVRNVEDGKPPIIRMYNNIHFDQPILRDQANNNRAAVFNATVSNLELRVGDSILACPSGDRTQFAVAGAPGSKFSWSVNTQSLLYDCEYRIPTELLAKPVRVEITEEFVEPIRDDLYYIGMVEPTEDFNLVCHFPENVRLELIRFSMADPELESPVGEASRKGHGLISIDGWLLPGHGACVAWYGMHEHADKTHEERTAQSSGGATGEAEATS